MGILELIVSGYLLTFPYIYLRFKTKNAFQRAPSLRVQHNFEITEMGVHTDTPEIGTGEAYWKAYVRFVQDNKVLLLYVSDRQFIMFPRRLLSENEWAELSSIVRSHVESGNREDNNVGDDD